MFLEPDSVRSESIQSKGLLRPDRKRYGGGLVRSE